MNVRAVAAAVLATTVVAGCSSGDPCADLPVEDHDCPDLRFRGMRYDEWRPVDLPAVREELGDGVYPACNDEEHCNGPDLDGFGSTDVWLVPGVTARQALAGNRQGTEDAVVFVRQGLDPADVPGLATAVEN